VRAFPALIAVFGGLWAGSGCTGTCRKTTPYVPFLEDAGTVAARDGDVAAADAVVDGGQKSAFQKVQAALAPAGATKWSVDGLAFDAPPGSSIVAALAQDVDGDGQRDVIAWTQPLAGGGGELRFHRGDGKGGLLAGRAVTGTAAGSDLSLPAPCVARPMPTMLMLVGPHSAAVDVRPNCGEGAPTPRRFAFVAFAPTPSIRWSARVSEPPSGWSFTIDVEATDSPADGDGVDDPTFVFGLEGGGMPWESGERVSAKVPYFDRPAGLARDRKQPELSFQEISKKAHAVAAAKKPDAPKALSLARRLRILHAALCAEGGSPWLEIGGERGVGCGASKALEDGGLAEVKASLASGDVLLAMATRERLGVASVARTKKTRDELDKLLEASAPAKWGSAKEIKSLPSTPSKGAPAWGALAFESSGKLLVRSTIEVVRVDPTTFAEVISDEPSWPWEVKVEGKDARLTAVADQCDAPSLSARFVGHDVPTGATAIPIAMLPTFAPNRCGGGGAHAPAVPVAWMENGLFTLVAHEPVIIPALTRTASPLAPATKVTGPFVQGAPRSPNGAWLVVPTRFGLFRQGDGSPPASLVRVKDLEGLYLQLRECAIADGGLKLACIRENKVVMIDAAGEE